VTLTAFHQLQDEETERLHQDQRREKNWKRWGPYLSERQWATVREDYSPYGTCWDYFPHEHARSRTYRWGEDGLMGLTDRQCRLCFSIALWNGRDPILKERAFGLTGEEGNHGEDVKECYFYLDSTPTHSYMKSLYKYPQAAFPYAQLVAENRKRGRAEPEYELHDTGIFAESRYFDVFTEYAKATPDDILVRITVHNRGPEDAPLEVLPTLWFRNHWSWGRTGEGYGPEPKLWLDTWPDTGVARVASSHHQLGRYELACKVAPVVPEMLFTNNETNTPLIFKAPSASRYVKDAFHEYVVHGKHDVINPAMEGTKCAARYKLHVPAGGHQVLELRLHESAERGGDPFGAGFDHVFELRRQEADIFFEHRTPVGLTDDEKRVVRQGRAGLLHSKQFYHYDVAAWTDGDPSQPKPPATRSRNKEWRNHLYNRDIISMPDKWEYPWYAAWDLAFHMIPFAEIDGDFAKDQLVLFLREWYMHPNGQIPAYEFAFGDVNPPVHAWACWRVYKMAAARGHRDRAFLQRCFSKLLLNFTWWVNRKDDDGNNIFGGGFLGLDNIGVFDRSQPLPTGGHLEQADGTAWMAFYCANMLAMAFELAHDDPAAEDMASKFFEHFIAIIDAMNSFGGTGLWDEQDGFYYDQIHIGGQYTPLRIRSMVGLIPLITAEVLEEDVLARMPDFRRRMDWLLANRSGLSKNITAMEQAQHAGGGHRLLAIPSKERLVRALRYVLDENEFLSPYGLRSLSLYHKDHPFVFQADGREYRVDYVPGDSTTGMFGGNSNWRGPVWFPLNYLLVEALERYYYFYGDSLEVECPTGSGRYMNLKQVAHELCRRLTRIFLPGEAGVLPVHGRYGEQFAKDPHWKDLLLFYEYFHADKGWGQGADHQTGWTSLVVRCLERLAQARQMGQSSTPASSELRAAARKMYT
jgi:hypothetical protein